MRKILTVALLASTLAAPAFAADNMTATPAVNAAVTAQSPAADGSAKPVVAMKTEKKTFKKHAAHKAAKKAAHKTM